MAYVRLDKVKNYAHIESVVHTADLKNGQFVELGILDEALGGEAVGIAVATEGKKPEAIIVSEFIDYGYPDFDYAKQVTKAGKLARAYVLEAGNTMSFSTDLVEAGLVAGDLVTVDADGLGIRKVVASEEVAGKVIGLDYLANVGDLTVVRFK